MAVIGHNLALVLLLASSGLADQASEALERVNYVATALSDNNPADAMVPFDKSLPEYEKLRRYFAGLTDGFQLTNEATVTDEEHSEGETKLTLQWTMTLTDPASQVSRQRTGEIHARLALRKGKWKIVGFSPANFFNPQQKQ